MIQLIALNTFPASVRVAGHLERTIALGFALAVKLIHEIMRSSGSATKL
jgi:hypothetical protein